MLRLSLPCTLGILSAALCLISPASAQQAIQATPQAEATPPAHATPLEISHGKPFVMVSINGRGPYRFVVDTGTGGQAFISPALASELGLTRIGHMHITDPSGRGALTTPLVLIPSLQLAGIEFTNIHAAIHAFDDSDGACQGLLGFALFRSVLLTLDYPHHQLQLTTGALTPDGERSVLPFRKPSGIPLINLRIGNSTIDALLDSGGAGLSLPESLASHMPFASDPVSFSNSFSLVTRFQIKAGRLAQPIRLGAYTFQQPFVEINPAFPIANFGSVPMQNFVVTFDQQNELVRFAATRQSFHLSPTPTPMRSDNGAPVYPPNLALIPVG